MSTQPVMHWMDKPTTPNLVVDILTNYGLGVSTIFSDKRKYTTYRKFCIEGDIEVGHQILDKIKSEMDRYDLQCNVVELKLFESETMGRYWGVCITNLIGDFTLLPSRHNKPVTERLS